MTFVVEVTEVQNFSECRRAWYWSARQRHRSRAPNLALLIGTVVHAGLEGYYQNARQLEAALSEFDKVAAKEYDILAEQFSGQLWDAGIQIEASEAIELGRRMIQNYAIFDQGLNQLEGDIVDVESTLKYQLSTQPDIVLSGRIDLQLQRHDGLWVVDTKTAKSRPNFAGLDVDDQLTGYMFLVWKNKGIIPRGALYNVLLKSIPTEPRVLKSGELSKDKSQKTTHELYLKSIQEHELDVFEYQEFLTFLEEKGWSDFFAREWAVRNEAELEAYERRTREKALAMYEAYVFPNRLAYPEPSTWTCSGCPFLQPCKAKDDGGDHEALLNSLFYQDVKEASNGNNEARS